MTKHKSKAGFSLIEVLVAVAITSIVAAMIATMMSHMGNVASFYSTKEDYDAIYRATQLLLLNENTCKYALRDATGVVSKFTPTGSPETQGLDSIYMATPTNVVGTKFIKKGEKYSNRLNIRDIYLERRSDAFLSTIPDANGNPMSYTSYVVDLKIVADNLSGGAPIAVKPIPVTVVLDGSNKIIDCFAQTSSAAMCSVLHAKLNSITGQCEIEPCPNSDPSKRPACPTPSAAGDCTDPIYFLAFTTDDIPKCQCVRTCSGEKGAPGSTPAPVYTY